jgi:thiamine-phosphate pyrophosphorylase
MGVPLFINDRLDIALAAEADGLHVGQKDLPLPAIRKLAPGLVVGVSVSSLREFEGSPEADYYGVGAVFPTGTKKNARVPGLALVRSIRGRTSIPLIGIGGIHKANAREVLEAGCDGVAVISSVLAAGGIRTATRILRKSLSRVRVRP